MKKIALFLAILMVVGSMPAWCLSETLTKVIDDKTKSDIRPVQDTAKILGTVDRGVDKAMDKTPILNKREMVLDPARKVSREAVRGIKSIVNGVWDILTSPFDRLRGEKEKEVPKE